MSNDLNYHRHPGYTWLASQTIAITRGTKTQRRAMTVTHKVNTKHQTSWLECLMVPNNLFFALPFVNKFNLLERKSQSLTKKVKCVPLLHGNGQKYADFHIGLIEELTALQSLIWLNTLPTSVVGGTSQLFFDDQSYLNASTASVPDWRNLELNLGNLVL